MEAAVRTLENYMFTFKEKSGGKRLASMYTEAIDALGTILNFVLSVDVTNDHQVCLPLLLLCASFLESEGMHIRAAALYIKAGDCLFAGGHFREALKCFLEGYQKASSTPSRTGKLFASIALLMAAVTALKLGGLSFFSYTIKSARKSVNKKTWSSIRRTKYYAFLRYLHSLLSSRPSSERFPITLQISDEFSNLAIGRFIKELLGVY
ncbi:MAG: hypothetical protein QXX87_01830 [Candidatus Jordarchaeales archaeon]